MRTLNSSTPTFAVVDPAKSTFVVSGLDLMWPNNNDSRTLVFTTKDATGAVVTGLDVSDIEFDYSGVDAKNHTLGNLTKASDGSFTQTVMVGLGAGSGSNVVLSASVKDKAGRSLSNDAPKITIMAPDEAKSELSVSSAGKRCTGIVVKTILHTPLCSKIVGARRYPVFR